MPLDHWLAFTAASAVMLAIPGPTVLLVVSYALGYGRSSALAVVAGVALGGFTAMTASMLGLGAVLAASSAAFTALRWIVSLFALLASAARRSLREPRVQRIVNRTVGSLLIGAGSFSGGWRKASA